MNARWRLSSIMTNPMVTLDQGAHNCRRDVNKRRYSSWKTYKHVFCFNSSERTDATVRYWMLHGIFSLHTSAVDGASDEPAETKGLEHMPHQIQAAILDDLLRRNAVRRTSIQLEHVARIQSSLTLQMNMLTVSSKCGRKCCTGCNPSSSTTSHVAVVYALLSLSTCAGQFSCLLQMSWLRPKSGRRCRTRYNTASLDSVPCHRDVRRIRIPFEHFYIHCRSSLAPQMNLLSPK
jgi:hypothetical protein